MINLPYEIHACEFRRGFIYREHIANNHIARCWRKRASDGARIAHPNFYARRLRAFSSDFENTLESLLENELGWKTSNTNNSFSIEGFDIRFNESEKYKGYEGIIRFTDLRTGKEFARYKFRIAEPDNVQKEIVKILESLPGA